MRLCPEEVDAARNAVLGTDGLRLLQYLRAVFFGDGAGAGAEIAQLALELGWIERSQGNRPKLTALGRTIADSAREYCDWLEDCRGLPAGLIPEAVAGKRVLDLGCGFGRYVLALRQCGAEAVGIDLNERYLQLSSVFAGHEGVAPLPVIRAGGERLPFSEARFDMVLCLASLAYMQVPLVLQEIARVLVDDGRCILVGGTMGTEVRDALRRLFRGSGIVSSLKRLLLVANSCLFQWIGRRLIPLNSARPTRSPAHLTARFLHRTMDHCELTVALVDHHSELIVATRRPRGSLRPQGTCHRQ